MKHSIRVKLLLTLVILLLGCGGGDSGSQAPKETISLVVSPASVQFSNQDQSAHVDVVSNSSWTIAVNTDWLTVSPLSGSNNDTITITAADNQTTELREATITLSTSGINKAISIFQEGKPEDTVSIPADSSGMRNLNSVAFSQLLGYGFNIGNSLDAVGGETAWGNPLITQDLMDSIKAAGFNAIRLPVAWSQFSDDDDFVIDSQWLARVKQVVDYAYASELYVVMNMHWDGGWMQPTYNQQEEVNHRLSVMWQQIALYFRDYDDHLLFAGTNEVMVEGDYSSPIEEYYTVQNSFNQSFVNAVRATGGRNAYRQLVVQGFNTNIDHTINFAVLPQDTQSNRLMVEVHFYDPYNFTLNENSQITQWGANADDPDKVETWANENYVDTQFNNMKTHFIDQGVGVILGEFGAISRLNIAQHEGFRVDWNRYVAESAIGHGLVPFYWDNGFTGNYGMGVFERNSGEEAYPAIIDAVTGN